MNSERFLKEKQVFLLGVYLLSASHNKTASFKMTARKRAKKGVKDKVGDLFKLYQR